MAAAPSIGRASRVESPPPAPEADATRELYERYAGQIYGFCLHKLGSREEAEDAVQNTFLNAFRGLRRGVVPQSDSAWLFKIAENVCLSRHRSSYRRGRIESPSDMQALQDVTPSPEKRQDELIGLEDALARMPETQRRAILLREWQGLSYREIAEEMSLTQAAVETLIFRARRTLAQGLEEEPKSRGWKRLRNGADAGSLLAILKAIFTGGAAVKAVATAVAVGTAVVVASTNAVEQHASHPKRVPAAASSSSSPSSSSPPSAVMPGATAGTTRAAKSAKQVPSGQAVAFVTPSSSISSINSIPGERPAPVADVPVALPSPTVTSPAATPPIAQTPVAPPVTQSDPPAPIATSAPTPPAPVSITPDSTPIAGPTLPPQKVPTPVPIGTVPKPIAPAPPATTPTPIVTAPTPTPAPLPTKPTAGPIQTTTGPNNG